MAEDEKESCGLQEASAPSRAEEKSVKDADAAQKAAEAARARLADNPWTENPDAARVTEEETEQGKMAESAPEPEEKTEETLPSRLMLSIVMLLCEPQFRGSSRRDAHR